EGAKFEDWVVSCTPQNNDSGAAVTCFLTQQVNVTKEGKKQEALALYQIGYIGPKKELRMIQTLPLGVRIEPGTSIVSAQKLIAAGKFTVCTNIGCQAVATISPSDLKTILDTDQNSVAFMN